MRQRTTRVALRAQVRLGSGHETTPGLAEALRQEAAAALSAIARRWLEDINACAPLTRACFLM